MSAFLSCNIYVFYVRSTSTWQIDIPEEFQSEPGWHMMRIQQNGPNASGQTYYLSVSGFEIYGKVTGVVGTLKCEFDSIQFNVTIPIRFLLL